MVYFEKDYLLFMKELPANNNRDWFQENKKRFQNSVQTPFKRFVADLIVALGPYIPNLAVTEKECIFRIYRDVRFSKDKSPYKTYISALISAKGRKDKSSPGAYIEMSAESINLYSGLYELSTDQLKKIRNHIASNISEWKALISDKSFIKTFGEIRGDKHKRLPKEIASIAHEVPHLFHKSFYYYKSYPAEMALDDLLINNIAEDYRNAIPINSFFAAALE